MKKSLLIVLVICSIFSCKNKKNEEGISLKTYDKIEELQWLIGNWSHTTNQEQSYENWIKLNDSTLFSHSFSLVENDTVFAEHLTLQQNKNELFLTVVAYKNRDDVPVTFKFVPSPIDVFTFENLEHDFPYRISYSNPEKNRIHAWIEGEIEGEFMKADFKFERN
ncbi:MAG: DUF6265 family protein [Xanthomarina sp.]